MASSALITIVGNLGREPETRYTPNGRMNVAFTVAVNRRRPDSYGEVQESTNWYRVTAWGRLAENLDRLTMQGSMPKGRQVFATGSLEAREYQTPQGETRTSLDINANEVVLLGPIGSGESETQVTDDVPF